MNQQDIHKLAADLREYASNPGYSHSYYADTMRQAADALATSPAAGEAGSVDTPEFHKLLNAAWAYRGTEYSKEVVDSLIVHIDAKLAFVHAEGRRSAMEELAKEKERADRAEHKVAELRARAQEAEAHVRLLSSTAQPLQQEGGKEDYPEPLSNFQEGQWWVQKLDEAAKTAADLDFKRAVAVVHHLLKSASDNLQQASTAQEVDRDAVLESAVQAVADRVGDADRIMAVNAYDAIRSLKSNRFAPHESAAQAEPWADFEVEPTGDAHYDAGNFLLNAAQEFWNACRQAGQYGAVQWLTGENGELLIYTRGEYRETLMRNIEKIPGQEVKHFAQATPEGADLPPLPKCFGTIEVYSDGDGGYVKSVDGWTADQMRGYAIDYAMQLVRTALAASQQAAEPVYQVKEMYEGWEDVDKAMFDCLSNESYEKRILYRAAPPQQVDTGGLPG